MKTLKHAFLDRFAPYLIVLPLVLVLILNSALVVGVQIAADYPLKTPQAPFLETETYEILDVHVTDRVCGYILWQDNQQWRLVITERHFHANRWRTVCDTILMAQNFEEEFTTSYGRIMVKLHGYADIDHLNWISTPVYRVLHVPGDFLFWNGLLLVLEVTTVWLLHKLRKS